MGRTERFASLDELLDRVSDDVSLVVLLDDWEKGLKVNAGISGADLKTDVGRLRKEHGDNLAFRAFNESIDLHWNGELGIVACPVAGVEEEEVRLPLLSSLPKMLDQFLATGRLPVGGTIVGMRPKNERTHGDYVRYVRLGRSLQGKGD